MNSTTAQADLMSALADGQLQGDEFAQALALLEGSAQARATWHAYHVVGDVLRSGESAVGRDDAGFVARLQARLADEPQGLQTPIAAQPMVSNAMYSIAGKPYFTRADGLKDPVRESANRSSLRWKMVAGCASVVAVAALSWSLLGGAGSTTGGAQLAQASGAAEAPAAQVMIRDPNLDALMAAHKQFGGTSALQMPAGFLRNATFEGPSR